MKRVLTFLLGCFLVCCISWNNPVYASGTNMVLYSNDYFTGDSSHANNIAYYFASNSHSVNVSSRPTIIYGMNANLQYAGTVFISTHGMSQGSTLVLDNTVFFTEADLISSVGAEFIFYSACYSAKTNTVTGNNLCSKSITNGASPGASAVIGYSNTVNVAKSRFYEIKFYERALSYSENVYTAYVKAKALFAAQYNTTDNVYTSVSMFGNGGLCI